VPDTLTAIQAHGLNMA